MLYLVFYQCAWVIRIILLFLFLKMSILLLKKVIVVLISPHEHVCQDLYIFYQDIIMSQCLFFWEFLNFSIYLANQNSKQTIIFIWEWLFQIFSMISIAVHLKVSNVYSISSVFLRWYFDTLLSFPLRRCSFETLSLFDISCELSQPNKLTKLEWLKLQKIILRFCFIQWFLLGILNHQSKRCISNILRVCSIHSKTMNECFEGNLLLYDECW